MKYWARFTLKMMARLGLAAAVTAWVFTQTSTTFVTVNVAPTLIYAGAFGEGWLIGWNESRPGSPWWYVSGYPIDPSHMRINLDSAYTNHDQILPGIELLRASRTGVLLLSHRLVCLMLLVATIATCVRWRKPAPPVETIAATGQE